MASPYAFVTLLTSDSYLPGALTLAAALKDIHHSPATPPEVDFQTVCLVTPETVDVASIKLLRKAFDLVVGVELIEENNERGLQLLGAPSPFSCGLYFVSPSPLHTTSGYRVARICCILSICTICSPSRLSDLCYFVRISPSPRVLYRSPPSVFFASISPHKHVPSDTRSFQVALIFLRSSRSFTFFV